MMEGVASVEVANVRLVPGRVGQSFLRRLDHLFPEDMQAVLSLGWDVLSEVRTSFAQGSVNIGLLQTQDDVSAVRLIDRATEHWIAGYDFFVRSPDTGDIDACSA